MEKTAKRKAGNTEIKVGKKKIKFKTLAALVILLIVVLLGVAVYQLYRYDEGVLSIYADQQDAYVELVMEQVALRDPDATDDQIIQEILGTLDASSGKYWTLSKNDYLVFVKDVLETNRYKGFTTNTYYVDQNASDYLNSLRRNWVTHRMIYMNGDRYIASGVEFIYDGTPYRICLLTNTDVILNNNDFLSAKITIVIMLILSLIAVLVTFMSFAVLMDKQSAKAEELDEHIVQQNKKIDELDQEVLHMEQYSTRWNSYNESVLQTFLEKLRDRNAFPLTLKKLAFDKPSSRDEFLEHAQMLLDKKVLRFTMDKETELLLIFVRYSDKQTIEALDRIQIYGDMKVVKEQRLESAVDMEDINKEFFE